MSSTSEEEKDPQKAVPLDLARNQMTNVRTVEAKAPLVMTSQSLRNMRVLAQSISSSNAGSVGGPTIITTNLVPPAVLKSDSTRTQLASIITSSNTSPQNANNLSRPTQIALSATPLVAQSSIGTSYHVPRGPAVVANLAAPRSNVTTVRTPMVVTAQPNQSHAFIRPPRTPSPAQNTAWLTNTSNGSQIKGATTVLSSPVRGASVTGKTQIIGRTQSQTVSTIRSGAILQNAITIGQSGQGQIHSFKSGTASIQAVTIAQVLPRTQAVVYNANTSAQFTPTRITVASTIANQRPSQQRQASQVTTTRLAVPVNVTQAPTRIVSTQATVFTTGSRISTVSASQPTVLGSTQARLVTAQPNVTIGRLNVAAATPTAVASNANLLSQTRIPLNLHSLVAVANNSQARTVQGQGTPKVITQQTPGTIHLTSLSTPVSKTTTNVTTVMRTISVSPAIVTQQRQPATVVPSQAISIAKVYPQSTGDNQLGTPSGNPTNVFLHTPIQATPAAVVRRSSSSPNIAGGASLSTIGQQQSNNNGTISLAASSTVVTASYTLGSGTYFYENSPTATAVVTATVPASGFSAHQLNRTGGTFANQQTSAVTAASFSSAINQQQQSQQQQSQIRPIAATVHGIVTNQQMRYNPVMVVEQAPSQQNRIGQQQYSMETSSSHHQQQSQEIIQQQQSSHLVTVQHQQQKITSSPRPSILRKRDHEGSPLKASKNLTPILSTMAAATAAAQQQQQQQQQQQHLQHSLHNQHHQPKQTSVSPPPRPNSEGNEHSSGSTTISATSSPGIAEVNEDSNPCSIPMISIKEEDESNSKPMLMEMSPRKKPRKQQLTGNDIMDEPNDDMQFISETAAGSNSLKKDTNINTNMNNNGSSNSNNTNNNNNNDNDSDGDHHEQSDEPRDGAPGEAGQIATVRKPASASLLNSYKQNWKATHNHYLRHSDVRPKDERRPTIMDLANQYRVQDKVNGWKIHHLTTQMEDLAEQEEAVYLQLTDLLKCTESVEGSKPYERDVNRINELIKGNLQRIKIINDGMLEAKSSLMKIFDHKVHVTDIINRCASKRNFKKREKS